MLDESIPTPRLMKKFQVTVETSAEEDYFVWGESIEKVKEAFKDHNWWSLKSDVEMSYFIHEVPKIKIDRIIDGIITPVGKWEDEKTFIDKDGIEYSPTDDPLLVLPTPIQETLLAERHGCLPLPGFDPLHDVMGIDPATGKLKDAFVKK